MSTFVEEVKRPIKKVKKEIERHAEKMWGEVTRPEVIAPIIGFAVGGPVGATIAYGGVAGSKAIRSMTPEGVPRPSLSSRGPAPRTVMAAERAERDPRLKMRRRASVMGGDYGALNVGTVKLGT